jgi:hypothetical protein
MDQRNRKVVRLIICRKTGQHAGSQDHVLQAEFNLNASSRCKSAVKAAAAAGERITD